MFKAGDRVQLTTIGESKYVKQSGGGAGTVAFNSRGLWTDVNWDNGHSNNYEDVDLIVVSAAPATLKAPAVKAENAEERVKYLYSVQDESGYPILNTRDREYARETKAIMGGKKAGIIIMAYAPVKEIR